MFGAEYPVIDTDPTFSRVVRYFRTSDYAAWAGATATMPALLYAWGEFAFASRVWRGEAMGREGG